MWPHAITVFNTVNDEIYPHVIEGVLVDVAKHTALSEPGINKSNSVTVFIPHDVPGYVDPKEYTGQGWTLKTEDDSSGVGTWFIKGRVPIAMSYKEAKTKYSGVFRVSSVDEFDYGSLQHWEVGGR